MARQMLLIYSDPASWGRLSEDDQGAINGEYMAYTQEMVEAGVMVAGDPLQGTETAKTVAPDGVVTDGPFADVAEHLGGYYIVDTATIKEACDWAAKNPGVRRGLSRVEVRPIQDLAALMES